MKRLHEDFKLSKLHFIETTGNKDILVDGEYFIRVMKESKDTKSKESSEVLQLMDSDIADGSYTKALNIVLKKYPKLDKAKLEKELDKYI